MCRHADIFRNGEKRAVLMGWEGKSCVKHAQGAKGLENRSKAELKHQHQVGRELKWSCSEKTDAQRFQFR